MEFKKLQSSPPVKPATPEEAREFLRGLNDVRRTAPELLPQHRTRDFINNRQLGSLQSIARRIMIDILKSPKRN